MKAIKQFFIDMITDRAGGTNSKIFWGSIFAIVLIVALFIGAEPALYQTLAFCMLSLFGISSVDNLTAPKIDLSKTVTENKTSTTETKTNVTDIVNNTVDKLINKQEKNNESKINRED